MTTLPTRNGKIAALRFQVLVGKSVTGADGIALNFHLAGKAAVHAVVAQQVGVGLDGAEVVDRHHLDVATAVLDDRAQDQAADATETVDANFECHDVENSRDAMPRGDGLG